MIDSESDSSASSEDRSQSLGRRVQRARRATAPALRRKNRGTDTLDGFLTDEGSEGWLSFVLFVCLLLCYDSCCASRLFFPSSLLKPV